MKKIVILLLCACCLLTGCFNYKKEKEEVVEEKVVAEKMSYSELNEIVNNYSEYVNVDIIDVRDEDLFNESHIIGSMNIPYNNLYEIIISNEREIIVYGATAGKSRQAAKDLIEMGYKNVRYIPGINNWPYDLEEE